jgi:Domain of unknown function (DUF4214)
MNTSNNASVNKDRILEKVRQEVNFRATGVDGRDRAASTVAPLDVSMRAVNAGTHASSRQGPSALKLDLHFRPAVSPQPATPPVLKEYRLADLLPFYDIEFVNTAYQVILRRAPDPSGLSHYLGKLRQGAHKVELLGWLRYSAEGKKIGVRIIGLAPAYAKRKFYSFPIIGRIAEIVFGIWNLPNSEKNHRANFNHAIRFGVESNAQVQESLQSAQVAMYSIERNYNSLIEFSVAQSNLLEAQINLLEVQIRELERATQQAIRRREAAHGELVAFAATRIGRDALGPIESSIQLLRTASDANRSATADSFGVIRQTQAQIGAVDAVQKNLQASLTSFQSSLTKSLELFTESKADRKSLDSLATSLQQLAEKKMDRTSAESLVETLKREMSRIASELRQADATLALQKADHTSLRAFGEQNDAAMRSLFNEAYGATQAAIHSKADLAMLDQAKSELRQVVNTGLAALQHRLQELSATKADMSVINSTHDEVATNLRRQSNEFGRMLQSLAETKVEKTWVTTAIAQAQSSMMAATHKADSEINAVLRTKADRLALDIAQGELRAAVRSLQATIDKLRERTDAVDTPADQTSQSPAGSGISNISGGKPVDRIRGI